MAIAIRVVTKVPVALDAESSVQEGQMMTRRQLFDVAKNAKGIGYVAQREICIERPRIDFALDVGMFE